MIKKFFSKENCIQNLYFSLIIIGCFLAIICYLTKIIGLFTLATVIGFSVMGFLTFKLLQKLNFKKRKIEIISVLVIVMLGLLLRIGANCLLKTVPVSDFALPHNVYEERNNGIFRQKESTAELGRYQTYYSRYPAWFSYMKIISFVYDTFGHNLIYIKIMNWILYAITCVLIYVAGKKAFNEKTGILASTFFACYPPIIVYTNITTPDHFSTLLFVICILAWIYMIKNHEKNIKKLCGFSLLNIVSFSLINYFKPLSVFGIIVFICMEILGYIIYVICKKDIKSIKFELIYTLAFIVVSIVVVVGSSKLLNVIVENEIHTKVTDATSLYLAWAYAVDENGNYNPGVVDKIYGDLMTKYEFDQEKVFEEMSTIAKEQFIRNIPYLPKIMCSKFKILYADDYSSFSWANKSNNTEYEEKIDSTYKNAYNSISNIFSCLLYGLSIVSVAREIGSQNKNKYKIAISLVILGYIMILLLGGTQSRYKHLIIGPLCIMAASSIYKETNEESI